MNIVLIGYRCTGKTTVGKSLAQKQGWVFVDTDEVLIKNSGRTVRDIVAKDGWEAFRKMEHDTIVAVCRQERRVIATGGGAVIDPANVAAMRKSGRVVWLKARPETIRARMTADDETDILRPSLTQTGLYEEIENVLSERAAGYGGAADFSIDTDQRTIVEIVYEIVRATDFAGDER